MIDDLGPLPKVHERHVQTAMAKHDIRTAVTAAHVKYGLSFAELLHILASILHSWTGTVLGVERDRNSGEGDDA